MIGYPNPAARFQDSARLPTAQTHTGNRGKRRAIAEQVEPRRRTAVFFPDYCSAPYLMLQPYGSVWGLATGWPFCSAASAAFT